MEADLTPSELDALRFIVDAVDAGTVSEDDIHVFFEGGGAGIGTGERGKPAPFTASTIEALVKSGLISMGKRSKNHFMFSLRPAARRVLAQKEIDDRRTFRDDVLKAIYNLVEGTTRRRVDVEVLAAKMARPQAEVEEAIRFLESHKAVEFTASSEQILFVSLTHPGVSRGEELLSTSASTGNNPHPVVGAPPEQQYTIDIFVSHREVNEKLAGALAYLLKDYFAERPVIRCTSVDEFMLPAGADINSTIRAEVNDCRVVVALLTAEVLDSAYVMFELGARWGTGKALIPLRLGIQPEELKQFGPLAAYSAPDGTTRAGVLNVLSAIANEVPSRVVEPREYEKRLKEYLDVVGGAIGLPGEG